MPNPSDPAAKVYALALLQVGQEQELLGQIQEDLSAVNALYDGDAWFRQFFTSPRIDRNAKWTAVQAAFEGQVCRPVLGLLNVMIQKGREALLDNVADQFVRYRDLAENRVHAFVTVAETMGQDELDRLRRRLEAASGKNVVLHEQVDADALGGASIRVGDKVIDRTLRRRLSELKTHLLRGMAQRS